MKTKFFLFILWLLLPQTLLAQVNAVVIHQKNGSQAMFFLADEPFITYSYNNLVVTTSAKELSMPVTDISSVTLENYSVPTKIDHLDVTADGVLLRQLPAGSRVQVFTADGKAVCTRTVDDGGNVVLDLSTMPRGVLIINTPATTIKVRN